MIKFFKRFFIPHLIILVITLVSFLFLYTQSVHIIEEQLISSRLAYLRLVRTGLDSDITNIVHSANQISNNPRVRSFVHINDPHSGPNIFRVVEVIDTVHNYNIDNPLSINTFAVFYSNGVIVLPNQAAELSILYPFFFNVEGMGYHEWWDMVFSENHYSRFLPSMTLKLNRNYYDAIQYITPIRAPDGNLGAIISIINNSAIQNMFQGLNMLDGEMNFILSSAGDVVSSMSG